MNKTNFLFICFSFLLFACKKNPDDSQLVTPSLKTNVYLVGKVGVGTMSQAVYWKNDSLVGLTGPNTSAEAKAITVSGMDVYVAGNIGNTIGYWKNGDFHILSDTNSFIGGSISYKGYVYMPTRNLNSSLNSAQYYRDNELITIPYRGSSSMVTGIAVKGIDVYTSGSFINEAGKSVASFWQNDIMVRLSDGSKNAFTSSILINDGDIYVSGGEEDLSRTHIIAKYWKNGLPVILSDSNAFEITTGLTVSGSNVFVSGYRHSGTIGSAGLLQAEYWKNDSVFTIQSGGRSSLATAVAASGSDVYVVYQDEIMTNNSSANYLKNGQPISLKDGATPATANSIFINQQ